MPSLAPGPDDLTGVPSTSRRRTPTATLRATGWVAPIKDVRSRGGSGEETGAAGRAPSESASLEGGQKRMPMRGQERKLIDSCGNDANAPPERRLPRNPGGPQGGRRRSLRRISGKPLAARKNRPQQPDSLRPDPECAASDPGRAAAPDRNPADQRKTAGSLTDTIYE